MKPELQAEHIRAGEKSIRMGKANLTADPKTGVFQIATGLGLLAWAHADSDPARSLQFLVEIVDTRLNAFSEHGLVPSPERQNDGIVFAAAADQIAKACLLGGIGVDVGNSHNFDIRLNSCLRRALGIEDPHRPIRYSPTKGEVPLFQDLESLATAPASCTLAGCESYWKASRNRRYANTIHQKLNLFTMAGKNIKEASNKTNP